MNILRRLGVFVLGAIFSFLLFSLALDYSLDKIFTSPANVKNILSDSKIYDTALSAAFDQLKTVNTNQGGSISFTDPAIKTAAQKSLTPAFLQQSTNTVIDGFYGWLNGTTTRPEFRIDLSGVKATFAVDAGAAAAQRVASLPACPPALSGGNFDAFSAICLPGGLKPNTVAAQTQADIASSKDFLPDPVITANNIKSSQPGQDIFSDKLKNVPKAYQQLNKVLMAEGLLALLMATGIIFLSKTRRKGFRRTGFALIYAGVFVAFLGWVLNYAANHATFSNNVLATQAQKVAIVLSQNVKTTCLIIGGSYLAVGAVAVIGSIFYKRGSKTPDPETSDKAQEMEHESSIPEPKEPEQPEDNLPLEPKETPKPKKSKKRVLVQ